MIEGAVNGAREVVIPIRVGQAETEARTFEAVIDTGYGGYLTLPEQVVDELALALSDFVEVVVAEVVPSALCWGRWRTSSGSAATSDSGASC